MRFSILVVVVFLRLWFGHVPGRPACMLRRACGVDNEQVSSVPGLCVGHPGLICVGLSGLPIYRSLHLIFAFRVALRGPSVFGLRLSVTRAFSPDSNRPDNSQL